MIRASTKLAFTLNAPLPSRPYDAPLPSCDGKSFAEVLSPVIPMYKRELFEVVKNRIEKHAVNAIALLKGKNSLTRLAGTGERQGFESIGPILH